MSKPLSKVCPNGHSLEVRENVQLVESRNGTRRVCLACRAMRYDNPETDEIVRLYVEEFLGVTEISKRTHFSRTGIWKRLQNRRVRLRPTSWGNRNRHLPQQVVQETVDLYRSGLSMRQVGDRLGLSAATIFDRLESAGEPKRSRSPYAHLKPRFEELREEGWSWAQLSRKFGCSESTAYRVVHGSRYKRH